MLIDNEPFSAAMIQCGLEARGFHTSLVEDGKTALKMITGDEPHLVMLGVGRPGLNGIEVLRRIRDASPVPVILMSASACNHEIVEGLVSGADDFVTTPLRISVLCARIRAVLRRAGYPNGDAVRSSMQHLHQDQ